MDKGFSFTRVYGYIGEWKPIIFCLTEVQGKQKEWMGGRNCSVKADLLGHPANKHFP